MAESLLKDKKLHRIKFESEQDVYLVHNKKMAESLKKIAESQMSLIDLRRHRMSQEKLYLESYNEIQPQEHEKDKDECTLKYIWKSVSKIHYCEGDVLLRHIPGISHYGICVGNDMVVHSVQDSSSGVNRKQKLQYLNGPQMYTVKLDTIEDFESGEEVTTTRLTPPLFSIFWERRNAKDIVKEALQKINTKSSLDSLAFVKHCTFMWRTQSIMIGGTAFLLNIYFLLDTKRAQLFSTYVDKHYNKLIAFNISMLLFCTFLAYISYVSHSDEKKSSTDEKSKFKESEVDIEKKLPDLKEGSITDDQRQSLMLKSLTMYDYRKNYLNNKQIYDSLRLGDRVEFKRGLYSHWGIYIGQGKICHLAAIDDSELKDNSTSTYLFGIGSKLFKKASVRIDDFWNVAGEANALINNSLDSKMKPLNPETIVKNALKRLGEVDDSFFRYNCEHFTNVCRYGHSRSK